MEKILDAELVIGLVGRIGTDTLAVTKSISEVLHCLHYETKHIKLTDFLKTKEFDFPLSDESVEQRYKSYIDGCNKIREKTGRNDFFITYAVDRIIEHRRSITGSVEKPAKRFAYILDQIKRPEEAGSLRRVYGQQFILFSCHIPLDERLNKLSKKISAGHAASPKSEQWNSVAAQLIERDEKESQISHGQRVSDVFPLADLIITATSEISTKNYLTRFFEALFGNFMISPTRDEFFQNLASNVALTSCDTARQVGAIIQRQNEIVSTGYNEAPKYGGGTYWPEDGHDARDVALGVDINTTRKRQMIIEIIQKLRDNELLSDNSWKDSEIEAFFIDRKDAPLNKSQILDSLEYGRAVHAEMAAITNAARKGLKIYGATLYCTTFPCHNCAKHIVASGIERVIFLEPYPKSFVKDLYPDSIQIDVVDQLKNKVQFCQFTGITPNRYRSLFEKSKLKDEKGNVLPWSSKHSQPVLEKLDQGHTAREVIFQKFVYDRLNLDQRKYIGLPD